MNPPSDHALLREAAEWFATLHDEAAGEDERRRWQGWLAASPAHASAWQRVESIDRPLADIAAGTPHGAARQALSHSGAARRRRTLQLLGLGGLLLGSGQLLRHLLPWQDWMRAYDVAHAGLRTGIGEQHRLKLDDGTSLALNTATAADVDYGRDLRRIMLHAGEVLIDSAPDTRVPPRPLVVDTRFGRLTALGTRFNVRDRGQCVELAVFAGAVRIQPAGGGASIDVPAGRQACFTAERIEPATPADPARELWSRGQLIADNIPLAAFVTELGRYTPLRLEIDEAAGRLRLLGVFRIAEPARDVPGILATLEQALPVRLRIDADQSVHIAGR